jgi:hypothetical protein
MLAALAGLAEPQKPVQAQGEVEVILLLPHGFEPAEISRPQGPFLLVIKSYDHERDHAFDAAAADQGVLPGSIARDQERWTGLVDLKAGDHLLQDHVRGDRYLKITIRP